MLRLLSNVCPTRVWLKYWFSNDSTIQLPSPDCRNMLYDFGDDVQRLRIDTKDISSRAKDITTEGLIRFRSY